MVHYSLLRRLGGCLHELGWRILVPPVMLLASVTFMLGCPPADGKGSRNASGAFCLIADSTFEVHVPMPCNTDSINLGDHPAHYIDWRCVVSARLHGRGHELWFAHMSSPRLTGTIQDLIQQSTITVLERDSIAHTTWLLPGAGATASYSNGEFVLSTSNQAWIGGLVALQPDSLAASIFLPCYSSNRQLPIRYSVNRVERRRLQQRYRDVEAEREKQASRPFPTQQPSEVLVSLISRTAFGFIDLDGKQLTESELTERYGPSLFLALRHRIGSMYGFVVRGSQLFYTAASLQEVELDTRRQNVIFQASAEGYYGSVYTQPSLSPTGRYLVVSGLNGEDWQVLWDVDRRSSVWDPKGFGRVVWSQDGSVLTTSGSSYNVETHTLIPASTAAPGTVLNDGMLYGIEGTKDTPLLFKQALDAKAARQVIGKFERRKGDPPLATPEIIGFADSDVIIAWGATVFVHRHDESRLVRIFDSRPEFAGATVALQYVYRH